MSATSGLLSSVAANRKNLFDLVAAIEREHHCEIDVRKLEAIIDSDYAGRDELSEAEAGRILLEVSTTKA